MYSTICITYILVYNLRRQCHWMALGNTFLGDLLSQACENLRQFDEEQTHLWLMHVWLKYSAKCRYLEIYKISSSPDDVIVPGKVPAPSAHDSSLNTPDRYIWDWLRRRLLQLQAYRRYGAKPQAISTNRRHAIRKHIWDCDCISLLPFAAASAAAFSGFSRAHLGLIRAMRSMMLFERSEAL